MSCSKVGVTKTAASPSGFLQRGNYPKELLALGIKDYRQVFFKLCRLINRVIGQTMVIHLIADGRRDGQLLPSRRLLAA